MGSLESHRSSSGSRSVTWNRNLQEGRRFLEGAESQYDGDSSELRSMGPPESYRIRDPPIRTSTPNRIEPVSRVATRPNLSLRDYHDGRRVNKGDESHYDGDRFHANSCYNPDGQRAVKQYEDTPAARTAHQAGRLGKFMRPEPLEKDIPLANKYEKWLDWKRNFDVTLSLSEDGATQLQKAGLLYTSVGEEVRKHIQVLRLPPMHEGPWCSGNEYFALSDGLNKFFRGLVDESVDFDKYAAAKQDPSEGVHKYSMRLRGLAERCGIEPSSVAFRHQLLKGMKDRTLAQKAKQERLSIKDVILQASRKELDDETGSNKFNEPWLAAEGRQPLIAALVPSRGGKRAGQPKRWERSPKRVKTEGRVANAGFHSKG